MGGCVAVVGKQDRHSGWGGQGVGGRPAKQRRRHRHSGVNYAAAVFVAAHSSSWRRRSRLDIWLSSAGAASTASFQVACS